MKQISVSLFSLSSSKINAFKLRNFDVDTKVLKIDTCRY